MRKAGMLFLIILGVALSFIQLEKLQVEDTGQKAETVETKEVLDNTTSSENLQVRPAIEWLDENEFVIYKGCGTECEAVYIFNLKENAKQKLYYGIKYTWSPNKKYVLAYHYAIQPGITVGDKFGNTLFAIKRGYPKNGKSVSSHKAVWSPDSAKLALIINKEGEEQLELLVFEVENDFKLLVQKDLESNQFSDLSWGGTEVIFYQIAGRITKISLSSNNF